MKTAENKRRLSRTRNSFFNWQLFFWLLGLSSIIIVIRVFTASALSGDLASQFGISTRYLGAILTVQSLLPIILALLLGLFFFRFTGLGAPLLEAWTGHRAEKSEIWKSLSAGLWPGVLLGTVVFFLDIAFANLGVTDAAVFVHAPWWKKIISAFYQGITVEILMRLLIMNFFVWLAAKIVRAAPGRLPPAHYWIGIGLSALILILGHAANLAAAGRFFPLDTARIVVFNGLPAVVYGWMFWRRGLESAMLAHVAADLILIGVLPYLLLKIAS